MGRLARWSLIFALTLYLAACGTGNESAVGSAVEGKLVDWSGKPVAKVTIRAGKIDLPILKGYEELETVTKADGSFRISGLFPSSRYGLSPRSDKWECKTSVGVIDSGPQGETVVLPSPVVIHWAVSKSGGSLIMDLATLAPRFTVSAEGIITDAQTGLEWVAGPDRDMNYAQAEQWVAECKVGGGGWRIPTVREIASLGHEGVDRDPVFTFKDPTDIWAEPHDSFTAWTGWLGASVRRWMDRDDSDGVRVLGVRSRSGTPAVAPEAGKVGTQPKSAARFTVSAEGLIYDSETGLEWVVGPDKDTNYAQAEQWVANCTVSGGGWRMPTCKELSTLYQEGVGDRNLGPEFGTSGWWAWAEPLDSSRAFRSYFDGISKALFDRADAVCGRVFGVRSRG